MLDDRYNISGLANSNDVLCKPERMTSELPLNDDFYCRTQSTIRLDHARRFSGIQAERKLYSLFVSCLGTWGGANLMDQGKPGATFLNAGMPLTLYLQPGNQVTPESAYSCYRYSAAEHVVCLLTSNKKELPRRPCHAVTLLLYDLFSAFTWILRDFRTRYGSACGYKCN